MKIVRQGAVVLFVFGVLIPATPAMADPPDVTAAHADFAGIVNLDCDADGIEVDCHFFMDTTVCKEVAGAVVISDCNVTIEGEIPGFGTREACALAGSASGSASGLIADHTHSGTLAHHAGLGEYVGTGSSGGRTIIVRAEWVAITCRTSTTIFGIAEGTYDILL